MQEAAGSDLLGEAATTATSNVPVAALADTVEEVRASLPGRSFENTDEIAVLDGRRFAGLVSLEQLFAAPERGRMAEIMDADPPAVAPHSQQEEVARKAIQHTESSIAVVDEAGAFIGLIPAHRLLGILLEKLERDMARLGGYLARTRQARLAAAETVPRRLWHRLPWLLLGLVGAMASAVIVGAFEEDLEATVLLSFFIPAIVYMAGAVGTQSEILLVRGLGVGVTIREILRRELITGVMIGLLIGLIFLPFAELGWGDSEVALAVALAMFASCSMATVVAVALPAALVRLRLDPAFGSGPVATVIQDLISIAVYLSIATVVVS